MHLDGLQKSRVRRVILFAPASILLVFAGLDSTLHFLTGKWLFNGGFERTPYSGAGMSITNPIVYSIHLASLWLAGLGVVWLTLSSPSRGVSRKHWLAVLTAVALASVAIFAWPDQGYDTDYPGIYLGLALFVPFLVALPLAAIPPFLPQLRLATRPIRKGRYRVRTEEKLADKTSLSTRHHWHVAGAWLGLLAMGLVFGLWVTLDAWDPIDGFEAPLQHVLGGTLPLIFAATGLLPFMHLDMGLRARRILFWILAVFLAVLILAQVVLALRSLIDLPISLVPVVMILGIQAWVVWTMVYLLEPCYGWRWTWERPT